MKKTLKWAKENLLGYILYQFRHKSQAHLLVNEDDDWIWLCHTAINLIVLLVVAIATTPCW